MVLLTIRCNWASSETQFECWAKQSRSGGFWDTISLSRYPTRSGWTLVVNFDPEYPPEFYKNNPRAIFTLMEPRFFDQQGWTIERIRNSFAHVLVHESVPNLLEWHLSFSWTDLHTMPRISKTKHCLSTIQTPKYIDEGQIKRLDFIRYLNQNDFPMDVFGSFQETKRYKGYLPQGQKDDGLIPYKYHFCAENTKKDGYVTEKLIDGILSECLVFYWGEERDLPQMLPRGSFIRLELDNFQHDMERIQTAIDTDEWAQRYDTICEAKRLILDQYQLLPVLDRYVRGAL
jgi:hypothetical protein